MCGIAGFITDEAWCQDGRVLQRMATTLVHRGPDDEGYFETLSRDGRFAIGLAHRRLSIIDLAAGHQPMGNEDGSIQVVFNGEIYNYRSLRDELLRCGHRFATHSDTETIVHAYEEWGTACVERFSGMFAFALWDATRQRMFFARDHFGKKPFYFSRNGETLLFGSEIKALLACGHQSSEVDFCALADYFSYRYVPAPATLFRGIHKLMPGTWALWEDGHFVERRYYQPPDHGPVEHDTRCPDPVGTFLDHLDRAVEMRMVSDVPFGAFLSGGIDSSAVVGLMSRHSTMPVRTFSIGFAEAAYSELDFARTVAGQFRTDHHELIVSEGDIMEHLPALIRFRDAPVAEPSDIPIYLLAREAARTVKMVLTGEGADEMLGGYPKHVWERYAATYHRFPGFFRHSIVEPLVNALPYRFHRAKTAIASLALVKPGERLPRWFGAMSPTDRCRLVALHPPSQNHGAAYPFQIVPGNSALRSILYFDQTSWLPDNLLERGDRMTMAASIEARMPFMDRELLEFVTRLPDTWRVRGRTTKAVLRDAMKRLLPEEILSRPKIGFRVPVNEWFQGPMRDYLHDHLLGPDSRTRDYYRPQALRQTLQEHVDGRQNHEKLLWALLNLEIWHRQYV